MEAAVLALGQDRVDLVLMSIGFQVNRVCLLIDSVLRVESLRRIVGPVEIQQADQCCVESRYPWYEPFRGRRIRLSTADHFFEIDHRRLAGRFCQPLLEQRIRVAGHLRVVIRARSVLRIDLSLSAAAGAAQQQHQDEDATPPSGACPR